MAIIAVPVGSLAVTGRAPTLVTSPIVRIAIPVGSLTFTGNAPKLFRVLIVIPAGTLTFTGRLATLMPFYGVLEMELNGHGGGWTGVSDWLRSEGIQWQRGLPGTGPLDLVADVGTMRFQLNNSETNSAATLGYYSPDHPSHRPGFDINTGVRYKLGGVVRWTGQITAIDVVPGTKGPRSVAVEAESWMGVATRTRLSNLPVLLNNRNDQVFQTLIDSLADGTGPIGVEKDIGADIFPYTLDRTRDEQTMMRDELYRLATSGLDRIWERGDGTLVYESRSRRATVTSTVDRFTDNNGFIPSRDREGIINSAQSTVHPRLPGTSVVVMYSLNSPMAIQPGNTVTILGTWSDPLNPNVRLGAVDLTPVTATTDYTANTAADGSGTNLTSLLTITTGLSGNATSFTITLGGSLSGFLTKLQQRGKPLYDYGPVGLAWDNSSSISQHGTALVSIDMAYQADARFGLEAAQYVIFTSSGLQTRISGFRRVYGITNRTEIARTVAREISDRISIVDELTGLDRLFFINSIEESEQEGVITTEWMLAPADATAFWLLEVVGRSELDSTTRLGFGLIAGHTDILHGDTHTDIAHSDSVHQDVAHVDIAHGDATGHNDIAHSDSVHGDTHGDVAHGDSHTDVAHTDYTYSGGHTDYHEDSPQRDFNVIHVDYWEGPDESGAFGPHPGQTWHYDVYGTGGADPGTGFTPHEDVHSDVTYPPDHNDVAHQDVAHSDVSHSDTHSDVAHGDVVHTDSTGHSDTGHSDVTHVDVNHGDITHGDAHTDAAHGDIN